MNNRLMDDPRVRELVESLPRYVVHSSSDPRDISGMESHPTGEWVRWSALLTALRAIEADAPAGEAVPAALAPCKHDKGFNYYSGFSCYTDSVEPWWSCRICKKDFNHDPSRTNREHDNGK